MADYYPLLSKAVGALPNSTATARRAVYERARKALIGQLRAIDPPIAEADIARESSALDEAVARVEAEIAARLAAEVADAPEAAPESALDQPNLRSDEPPRPRDPVVRPPAPKAPRDESGKRRIWIFAGVIVGVVLLIAMAAIGLRSKPEDLGALKQQASSEQPNPGKRGERADGSRDSAPAEAAQPQRQLNPASRASQQPLAVAHRAALIVEAPEVESKVRTFVGSVVWRIESVARGGGQPPAPKVRAEIEIPEASFRATIEIQKNFDASLPASHTIELRFITQSGSLAPGVQQIGGIQMRREEAPNGEQLAGLPVSITESYYLVGLGRGDLERRNLDLIKTRGWLDVPMVLSNKRSAKLTLEKGVSGERVFNEAIAAWEQMK